MFAPPKPTTPFGKTGGFIPPTLPTPRTDPSRPIPAPRPDGTGGPGLPPPGGQLGIPAPPPAAPRPPMRPPMPPAAAMPLDPFAAKRQRDQGIGDQIREDRMRQQREGTFQRRHEPQREQAPPSVPPVRRQREALLSSIRGGL